jgi:hypothetical protein
MSFRAAIHREAKRSPRKRRVPLADLDVQRQLTALYGAGKYTALLNSYRAHRTRLHDLHEAPDVGAIDAEIARLKRLRREWRRSMGLPPLSTRRRRATVAP